MELLQSAYADYSKSSFEKTLSKYNEATTAFLIYQTNSLRGINIECDVDIYSTDKTDTALKAEWDYILGKILLKWHQYSEAEELFNMCLFKSENVLNDILLTGKCRYQIGKVLIHKGDFINAFNELNIANSIFNTKGYFKGIIKIKLELSNLYRRIYKYDKALSNLHEVEGYLGSLKSNEKIARCCVEKGKIHFFQNEYEKSFEQFTFADQMLKVINFNNVDNNLFNDTKRYLCFLNERFNNLDTSSLIDEYYINYFIDSRKMDIGKIFIQVNLATKIRDLAVLSSRNGYDQFATAFLLLSKNIFSAENYGFNCSKRVRGRAHCLTGIILHKQGNYKEAKEHFDLAISFYKRTPSTKGLARTQFIAGILLNKEPDFTKYIQDCFANAINSKLSDFVSFFMDEFIPVYDDKAILINTLHDACCSINAILDSEPQILNQQYINFLKNIHYHITTYIQLSVVNDFNALTVDRDQPVLKYFYRKDYLDNQIRHYRIHLQFKQNGENKEVDLLITTLLYKSKSKSRKLNKGSFCNYDFTLQFTIECDIMDASFCLLDYFSKRNRKFNINLFTDQGKMVFGDEADATSKDTHNLCTNTIFSDINSISEINLFCSDFFIRAFCSQEQTNAISIEMGFNNDFIIDFDVLDNILFSLFKAIDTDNIVADKFREICRLCFLEIEIFNYVQYLHY